MNPPVTELKHQLSWNGQNDCTFEATITNNLVTDLHFCEPPAKTDTEQICLRSTNEHYLRQVASHLTELFAFVDRERAKTGTFAQQD